MPNGRKDWVLRVNATVKQKRKQKILHVAGFDKKQTLDQIRLKAVEKFNEFIDTLKSTIHENTTNNLEIDTIWGHYKSSAEFRNNTAATQLQKTYSFRRYAKFWKIHGKTNITQITREDVRKFQNSRKQSPVASNRDLSHMSHFIQFAVNEGYISENFTRSVKREYEAPGSDGIKLKDLKEFHDFLDNYSKEFCHENRTFRTNEDGTTFLDPEKLIVANFAKFIVLTGLRVSEARNLTYIPGTNRNYIYQALCSNTRQHKLFLKLNHHKTARYNGPRDLELIESAVDCIREKPPFKLSKFKNKSHYVFPSKRGAGPISRKTIDAFTRELNMRFRDFDSGKTVTIRSLRHTFARFALKHGLTHDELANILGHTTTAMIRKYYAKTDISQVSQAITKLYHQITLETNQ